MPDATNHARKVFKKHGGTLRTTEALAAGVHPRTLYAMRDAGELEQHARGVLRLSGLPSPGEPDLVTVAKRVPQGVLCLISALAFHLMTTQVPHRVQLALSRTARRPRLDYPPLQIFRFSESSFHAGIETHQVDGVALRVYSPEKTLADVFKYRNKIGMDVALEAVRAYRSRGKQRFQDVMKYARVCRVEKIIRPYLEATA
jgi:predicted transcriptional regulator of viral defense system